MTKIPLKFGLFTKMPRGSQIEFCDFWPMTKIPSKFKGITKMPLTWGASRQGCEKTKMSFGLLIELINGFNLCFGL